MRKVEVGLKQLIEFMLPGLNAFLGHSALTIFAGTSVGFVQKINASEKYNRISVILKIVMGIVILGIALYMFYLGF